MYIHIVLDLPLFEQERYNLTYIVSSDHIIYYPFI